MDLQPNCGSDRAWVWKADDYADEALKRETLAIRFANAESELFIKFVWLHSSKLIIIYNCVSSFGEQN